MKLCNVLNYNVLQHDRYGDRMTDCYLRTLFRIYHAETIGFLLRNQWFLTKKSMVSLCVLLTNRTSADLIHLLITLERPKGICHSITISVTISVMLYNAYNQQFVLFGDRLIDYFAKNKTRDQTTDST